jgi:hypothetical protein
VLLWRSIVSCDEVRQQLPDHVLGTLPEIELAAIRRHLRGCAGCRSEASDLDEGVALFASAAHVAEPPPELRPQVMAVLAEEWSETEGEGRARRRLRLRWPAVATAAAVVAGILVWAVIAQVMASSYRDDALSYRHVLDTLGGTDIRVAALEPAPGSPVQGSALVYDSMIEQSWVGVLVRAPGYTGEIKVMISAPSGRSIELFPMEVEDGRGDTWLTTESDLTGFDTIRLTAPDGRLLASCRVSGDD